MFSVPESWLNAFESLSLYWKRYGGIRALVLSPYFGLAALLTIISAVMAPCEKWHETALGILPNLLGFSIGGFAVLLVFSSDRFLKLITEGGSQGSLFLKTNVIFVHFILVQVLGIITALLAKAISFLVFASLFLLFYSILSAVATCLVLFNIAQIYNSYAPLIDQEPANPIDDSDAPV